MKSTAPIQFVATDIDFTFLDDHKAIPPANLEAIQNLQKARIPFAFATGRYWTAIKDWVKEFKLTAPQIIDNGAVVFDPVTEQVIHRTTLDRDAFFYLIDLIQHKYDQIAVCSDAIEYHVCRDSEEMQQNLAIHQEAVTIYKTEEELLKLQPTINKVTVYSPNGREAMKKIAEEIRQSRFADSLHCVFTEPTIIVITDSRVSKFSGIATAARAVGVAPEATAAIGDGDNDQEMLESCGYSFAMANGTPLAKKAAKFITEHDCNQAGFAEAVNHILQINGIPN